MNEMQIVDITREAIWLLIKLSAPFMIVSLVVGVAISLFQALTQIQEMTLVFVPKMLLIFMTLMFFLPSMLTSLTEFNERLANMMIQQE